MVKLGLMHEVGRGAPGDLRYVPSTAIAAVGSTLRRKPTATRAERITRLDLECTPFGRTGGWFGLGTQGEELSG